MTQYRHIDWCKPRPFRDAPQRLHTYGPVRPMDPEPSWFARLLRKWS